MKIQILHGIHGAGRASGSVVVIDVLRAFTTACYVVAAGARRFLAVTGQARALAIKKRYSDCILMGERNGLRIPGFDLGNSPHHARKADFTDKTVVLTTSNGTRGLSAAIDASQVFTGSFVNAGALIRRLGADSPQTVSLVCMGSGGRPAIEDTLCAQYIQSVLRGNPQAFEPLKEQILQSREASIFKKGQIPDMPPEDLELSLHVDRFDFVLQAERGARGCVRLKRIDVPQ